MEEEQIELLKQIAYGVRVITEKVNNKFRIKQDLPEDIFNIITTYF